MKGNTNSSVLGRACDLGMEIPASFGDISVYLCGRVLGGGLDRGMGWVECCDEGGGVACHPGRGSGLHCGLRRLVHVETGREGLWEGE